MPQYRFKDQSGKYFKVDAPEGMSEGTAHEAFLQSMSMQKKKEPAYDPTAEMSWGHKALVNLGAGVDTAWQGVKQVLPGVKGMTDEELEAKRALDDRLAESTTGGGALQLAGEIAPSLAIPGGGFVRGGKLLAQGGANLGRLAMGGEAKALATQATRGLGTFAADSAIAGGVGGFIQPVTESESRYMNTLIGGAAGMVLPGMIAAARKGASFLTQIGAQDRAAAQIIQRLGGAERATEVLQQAQGHGFGPKATRDIPLTTAEVTQNPTLGMMERRVATNTDEDWVNLRKQQNQGRADLLESATSGADNLKVARDARDEATRPMRERAIAAAGKDKWFHVPVVEEIAALRASDEWANPNVQKLVGYVQKNLDDGITPGRLYQVRKILVDNLKGPRQIGDDLSNAAKGAEATVMRLKDVIDNALDTASKGKWTPYLQKYGSKSGEVNDAEASALLRETFTGDRAARRMGVNDMVPAVSGDKLGKALDKFGKNEFGPTFAADTRAQLDALRDNIAKTEGLQGILKQTGTSGGGSNTAMDFPGAAERLASGAGMVGKSSPFVSEFFKSVEGRTKAAVSDALRNPDVFIRDVSRKLSQNKPLTESERAVMMLLRSSNVAIPQALE